MCERNACLKLEIWKIDIEIVINDVIIVSSLRRFIEDSFIHIFVYKIHLISSFLTRFTLKKILQNSQSNYITYLLKKYIHTHLNIE